VARILTSKALLFGYFIAVILAGSVVLSLDVAWEADGSLRYLDALFTATSAVCVTGLIVVDTSEFSVFGIVVIIVLIQAGGLGIITFGTLYLTRSGGRISLANRRLIKDYYLDSVEYDPKRILRNIVILSFSVELVGAVALTAAFRQAGVPQPLLNGVFHAVSAFANAGFSLFDTSLERFAGSVAVTVPVMALIVVGGIGFVVLSDLHKRSTGRTRVLSLHTRLVLSMSVALVAVSTVVFFVFEGGATLSGAATGERWLGALFQAVTPRTAGFNTVIQSDLALPSQIWTMLLMFVGGAPGSIAGGVKVTTIALVLLLAVRRREMHAEIRVGHRKINPTVLNKAGSIVIKSLFLVFSAVLLLSVTENLLGGRDFSFLELTFETLSAFCTVGLSLGITAELSDPGRVLVILVMFGGRLGIIAMAMPGAEPLKRRFVDYPEGDVLLG